MLKITIVGLFIGLLVLPMKAFAENNAANISGRAMGKCLYEASNTTIKLRPSFQLIQIYEPKFHRSYNEKDEVGMPIEVARYNGKIDVEFAGQKAVQLYSCTFWRDKKIPWSFSWTGLGATHVEGYQ